MALRATWTMAWTIGKTLTRKKIQRTSPCTEPVRPSIAYASPSEFTTSRRPKLRRAKSSPRHRRKASLRPQQQLHLVLIVQRCRRSRKMPSYQGFSTAGTTLRLSLTPRRVLDHQSGSPLQVIAMMITPRRLGLPYAERLHTPAVAIIVIATHSWILPRMDLLQMALMSWAIYPPTTV
jgi:hypothetical protein